MGTLCSKKSLRQLTGLSVVAYSYEKLVLNTNQSIFKRIIWRSTLHRNNIFSIGLIVCKLSKCLCMWTSVYLMFVLNCKSVHLWCKPCWKGNNSWYKKKIVSKEWTCTKYIFTVYFHVEVMWIWCEIGKCVYIRELICINYIYVVLFEIPLVRVSCTMVKVCGIWWW